MNASTDRLPNPIRRHPVVAGVVCVLLVAALVFLLRPAKSTTTSTAFHEAKRGNFTVSVVEPGTLAAVSEVSIRSEVEGTARIITIVPEGSYVKKGDLLVELDSSQAQDQVNQQEINTEKAKFAVEQAEATLEIMKSTTNSDYLAAALKVKFAQIDLDKYMQGQQMVDLVEASNKVVQAAAQLKVNEDTYINSSNLALKGYETKQKVDGDRLTLLNSYNTLTIASNTLWMLKQFDVQKSKEKYTSDLDQAEQELKRVVSQNRRKMAQYEADLETQKNTLALSEAKLIRDKKNLAGTKIYAPQDGLVVYQVSENRFSSESLIEGGATVRNRQELIKLPDLSRMKVTVKIHESHINMIRPGLPAFVILDSAPEVRYSGVVEKVAPLPDTQMRWGNPNLKVYNTDVYLTESLPNIKPGVSAKAEIVITNIADALSVPIQSVTTLKGKQVVYLAGAKSEPRPVEVGMYNTKFIEITKGLNVGDRVLLSPPFDLQEKDLEGGVLAADEKAKVIVTNVPARTPAMPQGPNGGGPPVAMTGAGGPGGTEVAAAEGGGRRGGFNREAMMKEFDKNGDGQLDDAEKESMRSTLTARFGAMGGPGQGGGMPNREEMVKKFDKNGDGKLDEEERAAMRASFGGGQRDGNRDGERKGRNTEGTRGGSEGSRNGGESAPAGRTTPPSGT